MSKLTSKERNALPSSDFAEPRSRKYPVENASHARNALSRVSESLNRGDISVKDANMVREKAHRVLEK